MSRVRDGAMMALANPPPATVNTTAPIPLGYDGPPPADPAITRAFELFTDRSVEVVCSSTRP